MTASPPSRPDTIAVIPASLGAVAGEILGMAAEVRHQSLHGPGVDAIGSPHCSDALARSVRLVEPALHASAQALEDIARALRAASGAYGLADLVAFRQASG